MNVADELADIEYFLKKKQFKNARLTFECLLIRMMVNI